MPATELIDLSASRRIGAKSAANVQTAISEAAAMTAKVNAAMLLAQLNAIQGWDASDAIAQAQEACEALQAQLRFAGALAERKLQVQA